MNSTPSPSPSPNTGSSASQNLAPVNQVNNPGPMMAQNSQQPAPVPSQVGALPNNTFSQEKPWYDSLFHGGGNGKMSKTELNEYSTLKNQLMHETDPEIIKQLNARTKELTVPDRGGTIGALGRAFTGEGQTTGENLTSGLLKIGAPLIAAYAKQAFANQANDKQMANMAKLNAAAKARMQTLQ